MEKKYISFDIEASGQTPGKYSMLSLGACLVDDPSTTFYRELKPISMEYELGAMKVGCLGLYRLQAQDEKIYDASSDMFDPERTLELLMELGDEPTAVMREYKEWVRENTIGFTPIQAAAPVNFDAMFTSYYFDNFLEGSNPFGYNGEDINSMYRGVTGRRDASIKEIEVEGPGITHNALDDAIHQALQFRVVLDLMRAK